MGDVVATVKHSVCVVLAIIVIHGGQKHHSRGSGVGGDGVKDMRHLFRHESVGGSCGLCCWSQ